MSLQLLDQVKDEMISAKESALSSAMQDVNAYTNICTVVTELEEAHRRINARLTDLRNYVNLLEGVHTGPTSLNNLSPDDVLKIKGFLAKLEG